MEKYSEYKDSGVQWLGEIPSHWETRRIKWLFKEEDEKNDDLKYQLLTFSRNKGIIPFADVNDKTPSASDLTKYKVLHPGQLLENRMQAWSGMFGCSYVEGCVSPDYSVFSPYANVSTEFFAHLFRTKTYIQQFANASKGIGDGFNRLYTPQFHKIVAIYPPYSEQQVIVSYLDDKCGKIDKLLENKAKELEQLAEMKQRVIADAVTKGLNPDVTMKDSGIPWLPQIPEHWETRKMKYVFNERSEKNHPEEPMLSATQTEGVIWQSKYKGRVVVVNAGFENLKFVKVGDFVIHLRSFQGGIEYAYDQGIISSAYTILEPRYTGLSGYYKYLFKSRTFIDLLKTCVTGIREGQNINYFKLKQNEIPFPSETEAEAIVAHIEEKVSKIDALAEKLQKEIESIKEYKQRLISDVVTGQIKVC